MLRGFSLRRLILVWLTTENQSFSGGTLGEPNRKNSYRRLPWGNFGDIRPYLWNLQSFECGPLGQLVACLSFSSDEAIRQKVKHT